MQHRNILYRESTVTLLRRLPAAKDHLLVIRSDRRQATHSNQDIHLDRDIHRSSSNNSRASSSLRQGDIRQVTVLRNLAQTSPIRTNSKDPGKGIRRFRVNGGRVDRNLATLLKIDHTTPIDQDNTNRKQCGLDSKGLHHSNNLKNPKSPILGHIQV